eukprot:scaffold36223_cov46-Prasinocladus_malaysianus.AAC.1
MGGGRPGPQAVAAPARPRLCESLGRRAEFARKSHTDGCAGRLFRKVVCRPGEHPHGLLSDFFLVLISRLAVATKDLVL